VGVLADPAFFTSARFISNRTDVRQAGDIRVISGTVGTFASLQFAIENKEWRVVYNSLWR